MDKYFKISHELRNLYKVMVSGAEIIMTVDHVYASPPTRLVDSHNMARIMNADILIVTSNKPDRHKYKYDLILDSGIYSSNNNKYHLFPSNLRYFDSQVCLPNFSLQRDALLNTLMKLSNYINADEASAYLHRFDCLVDIYEKLIKNNREPSSFYVKLLYELYSLIGAKDIGKYVNKRALGLHNSRITSDYIPAVIKQTRGTVYGLKELIANGIIKKNCYVASSDYELSADQISESLTKKEIVPNYQLVLWASSFAGIQHFGNDMNFHKLLAKYYREQGAETEVDKLQLTKGRNDGRAFAQFIDTYCHSLNEAGTNIHSIRTKPSRVNNLCNLYCHSGEVAKFQWQEFISTGKPIELSMKDIKL